ncbi:hypothetical protein [Treponema sp.]|uniref:hypothetical protein n=1 Tax=Treponema sp. TaxID=166 RepID=UPI00388D79B3
MQDFKIEYHKALCSDAPDFLKEYISLPILQRLDGIGLLCGTDWTPLFHNYFKYSRLDHSIGTALITWNFTKDKKQTIASLLHDVSTPAFSHVSDFKNGDALTQSSTEDINARMIDEDKKLQVLLSKDGIKSTEVNDYHLYPICDNEMPGLSADRLEYMYPSGAALDKVWTIEDAVENYSHIKVLENEKGLPELGFDDMEACLEYTKKFIDISLILQHNEDKIAMQLMADVLSAAEKEGIAKERDFYELSEEQLIERFNNHSVGNPTAEFSRLYRTFRGMKKIIRSEVPVENAYCIDLKVKQRYVDPLVQTDKGSKRISALSSKASKWISDFLDYKDSKYGCVEYL